MFRHNSIGENVGFHVTHDGGIAIVNPSDCFPLEQWPEK